MAPHRSRLFQVMPPLRSQDLAAAGRHGDKALRARAPAAVADRASTMSPTTAFFMVDSPLLVRIFRAAFASSIDDLSDNRKDYGLIFARVSEQLLHPR